MLIKMYLSNKHYHVISSLMKIVFILYKHYQLNDLLTI